MNSGSERWPWRQRSSGCRPRLRSSWARAGPRTWRSSRRRPISRRRAPWSRTRSDLAGKIDKAVPLVGDDLTFMDSRRSSSSSSSGRCRRAERTGRSQSRRRSPARRSPTPASPISCLPSAWPRSVQRSSSWPTSRRAASQRSCSPPARPSALGRPLRAGTSTATSPPPSRRRSTPSSRLSRRAGRQRPCQRDPRLGLRRRQRLAGCQRREGGHRGSQGVEGPPRGRQGRRGSHVASRA